MKGYVGVLKENNEMYLESYSLDFDWDCLHIYKTENIEKALFLSKKDKSRLESSLIEYSREDEIYFIKVERNTIVIG